jgi:Undecaprenyl-phosphate glucose phosphotransferase
MGLGLCTLASSTALLFASCPKMKHRNDQISKVVMPEVLSAPVEQQWSNLRKSISAKLPRTSFIAPRVASAFVRVVEAMMVVVVAFATLAYYPGFDVITDWWPYVAIILVASVSLSVLFQVFRLYHLTALLSPMRHLPAIVGIWASVFGALSGTIFLGQLGTSLSRGWYLSWAISGIMFAIAVRFGFAALMRHFNKDGRFNRRAVLVGGGEAADHVIATLSNSPDTGLSLVGIFDDRHDQRSPNETRGLYKLGTVEDLIDFVRATRIDTLILTLPVTAEKRLLTIMNRLWVLPVDIRLSAHGQQLRYRPRAYSYIGNLPLLDLFDRPLGDWGPLLKTIADNAIAALALVLLSPVLALVALAVKLESKGPVIFKQNRYGFNNELIKVYKFRSMYTDMTDRDANKLVTKDDPRVTKVGKFIRKTSLDELPQLLNVLQGNLSLVGPRPHATKASAAGNLYEIVVDGYFARHKVKPGITGWAQINGWRGETDTAEKIERRVEHDLYYIENWSLTFDLYILARTPFALLKSEHAY